MQATATDGSAKIDTGQNQGWHFQDKTLLEDGISATVNGIADILRNAHTVPYLLLSIGLLAREIKLNF